MSTGKIVQIIGAVVDVEFPQNIVPKIYNALIVTSTNLTMEVEQQIGGGVVRCIAMGATEGLSRGLEVTDTGKAITVPVGTGTLGRIVNVLGEAIDECGELTTTESYEIHREAPSYEDQSSSVDTLEVDRIGLQDATYDFAICRAQPDNNIELILDTYAKTGANIVFVSNWSKSL